MKKDELIALLNEDLEGEHGAIIQYLIHAYAMGEGGIACEIEAIAREEMRHLDLLAETIADLGGTPSITRGKMIMDGQAVTDWMRNDVLLEEDAINLYKKHIELVDDRKVKRTLERILSDEESHRGEFSHFVEKTEQKGLKDIRGNKEDAVTRILNWGIEHEYTVILQYLLHSYMAKNDQIKEEMQDQAVNEMQHLGWLAEEMVGSGGNPRIEYGKVILPAEITEMLKADISIERLVAKEYDKAAGSVSDASLKKLLTRISEHERYHVEVFEDLLKEI